MIKCSSLLCSLILYPLPADVASPRPPLAVHRRHGFGWEMQWFGGFAGDGKGQSTRSPPVAPLVQSERVNPVQMSSLRAVGAPVSEPPLSFTMSRLIVPSRPAWINIHILPFSIVFKPTHKDGGAKLMSRSDCCRVVWGKLLCFFFF